MAAVTTVFNQQITSEEELRALIGQPSEMVKRKVMPALDDSFREFIAFSPFLLISTANANGQCDVSPRGDTPGFVLVLDDKHLVIPERPGNKRADTFTNILANSQVGLIFLVPGRAETLRVNGRACIFQDKNILEQMAFQDKVPVLGIGVEVGEAFLHCAKAFKRSHLWEKESWPEPQSYRTMGQMLESQVKMNMTATEIDCAIEESYRTRLY